MKLREIQERITPVSPAAVRVQVPIEFNHVTPAPANGLTAAADLAAARQAIQSAEAAASAAVPPSPLVPPAPKLFQGPGREAPRRGVAGGGGRGDRKNGGRRNLTRACMSVPG